MARERTPDEIRRLKARGLFDVGTFYLQKRPFDKEPKRRSWDEILAEESD